MTNSKSTKSSLLTSSISLVLCFAMLLGTTFAWFTDSAVSASNVITSGNLDIDVWYTLGDKDASGEFVWNKLDNAKDLFQKGLWEPGHTEVVVLKIENKGSLALKYSANMNIVSETVGKTKDNKDITLSDILTVSTCTQQYTDANGNVASGADIFPAMAFNGKGGVDGWIGYQSTTTFKAGNVLKNDKQLQPKESDYIAVKVDMAETVGNEANHDGNNIPEIYFGMNVLATQFTYENDSFGNQYDKDAEYEEPGYPVNNVEELKKAIADGETKLYLNDGEYDIDGCGGKTLTLSGSKNAVIKIVGTGAGEGNGQIDYGFDGSNVTFNGVTIKTNNQTYAGYARLNGVYNNCTFVNTYCLNGTAEFNNCTFNISGDQYNIWTWGAPTATFNSCTFNSDGKAVLLYGTANTKLTVNKCTFNDKGGLTDLKAAIEIGNDYGKSYELIVNNTTVNGYEINDKGINTGSTLWANKNSMGTDKLNVVVDGVDVY